MELRLRLTKKRLIIGLPLLALLCAGGALAYFMLTGTGDGTASVAGAGTLTVQGMSADDCNAAQAASGFESLSHLQLTPGSTGGVCMNVTFNGADGATADLESADFSNATIEVDADHVTAGCDASWFSLDTADLQPLNGMNTDGVGGTVRVGDGSTETVWTGPGAISMSNTDSDQSACVGATITVHNITVAARIES